jgi:hypothetical protein
MYSYGTAISHSTTVVTSMTTVVSFVTATLPSKSPEPSTGLISSIEGLDHCSVTPPSPFPLSTMSISH